MRPQVIPKVYPNSNHGIIRENADNYMYNVYTLQYKKGRVCFEGRVNVHSVLLLIRTCLTLYTLLLSKDIVWGFHLCIKIFHLRPLTTHLPLETFPFYSINNVHCSFYRFEELLSTMFDSIHRNSH